LIEDSSFDTERSKAYTGRIGFEARIAGRVSMLAAGPRAVLHLQKVRQP